MVDCLIYALAITSNLTFITGSHFKGLPKVEIIE